MIVRRSRMAALAAALTFALSPVAFATPGGPAQDEIGHLLEFVAASTCTFVRNGAEYPADKASTHLAGKYRFAGATRIATAEDFIRDLATRSSVSGEVYRVKCGSADVPTGTWLAEELQRYRNARVRAAR